jgi:hypothetical protein
MSALRRTLVLSVTLAALLGQGAPALARPLALDAPMLPAAPQLSGPHGTGAHGGRMDASSINWAGYAATGRRFTSVSSAWVQPAASCTSADTWSSFWVGLDGDGSNTVEQTGSSADCSGGSPRYYSWYEMYPAYPVTFSDPVSPGDYFTASVTAGSFSQFTLVITDHTKGWSHTVRKTLRGARLASAEVIAEAPSSTTGVLPLTDFGTVRFTGSMANGQSLGSSSPTRITMADRNGTVKAATSVLSSGTDFSVAWQHS